MKKDNIINIDLSSLVDYLRDKDIEIEHLSYQLNEYKRICEDYERVLDKIKEYLNNNANEDLSVDCYYKFKDLYEYDEIKKLLEEIEDSEDLNYIGNEIEYEE